MALDYSKLFTGTPPRLFSLKNETFIDTETNLQWTQYGPTGGARRSNIIVAGGEATYSFMSENNRSKTIVADGSLFRVALKAFNGSSDAFDAVITTSEQGISLSSTSASREGISTDGYAGFSDWKIPDVTQLLSMLVGAHFFIHNGEYLTRHQKILASHMDPHGLHRSYITNSIGTSSSKFYFDSDKTKGPFDVGQNRVWSGYYDTFEVLNWVKNPVGIPEFLSLNPPQYNLAVKAVRALSQRDVNALTPTDLGFSLDDQ